MGHSAGRQPPQFGIHQWKQFFSRTFLAATDRLQNLCDLGFVAHNALLYINETEIQEKEWGGQNLPNKSQKRQTRGSTDQGRARCKSRQSAMSAAWHCKPRSQIVGHEFW